MSEEIKESLVTRTIVQDQADLYEYVTQAVDYVHKLAMDYRVEVHRRLMGLHPAFGMYRGLLQSWARFEPFLGCFGLDIQRFGCPWQYCTVMKIEKRKTVIHRIGERIMDLYLVHSGSVGVYEQDPMEASTPEAKAAGIDPFSHPHAVYKQGWFLNREML